MRPVRQGPRKARLAVPAALLLAVALGFGLPRRAPPAAEQQAERARAEAWVAPAALPAQPLARASTPAEPLLSVAPPARHAGPGGDEMTQKPSPGERPIPDFKPEPGADDPGPGPYVERYDGRSGRLSPHATPGGGEVTTRVSSLGPAPVLTVWVPSIRVQAGAEVVLRATLLDERGARVQAALVALVAAHGESPAGPEQPLREVAGAEHQYELRFPARAGAGAAAGGAKVGPAVFDYVVLARGTSVGEAFERTAVGTFLVHAAGGRIDAAAARFEKTGPDLLLLVPARIEAPGTYWMYAELWGGAGGDRPIAFARDRFERLPPGARTLTLSFGGAVIRDSAIDGPYLVRNLRFQQVDAFPPQEAEPIAQLGPSAAFRAADFN